MRLHLHTCASPKKIKIAANIISSRCARARTMPRTTRIIIHPPPYLLLPYSTAAPTVLSPGHHRCRCRCRRCAAFGCQRQPRPRRHHRPPFTARHPSSLHFRRVARLRVRLSFSPRERMRPPPSLSPLRRARERTREPRRQEPRSRPPSLAAAPLSPASPNSEAEGDAPAGIFHHARPFD